MALLADQNNRQLHPDEKRKITDLSKTSSVSEQRLTDAACAAVHCAAEFAPGTPDYQNAIAQEQRGAADTGAQQVLADAKKGDSGFLSYGSWDKAVDKTRFTGNVLNKEVVQPTKQYVGEVTNSVADTLVDGAKTTYRNVVVQNVPGMPGYEEAQAQKAQNLLTQAKIDAGDPATVTAGVNQTAQTTNKLLNGDPKTVGTVLGKVIEVVAPTVAGKVVTGVADMVNAGQADATAAKTTAATKIENNIGKDAPLDPYAPVPNAEAQGNLTNKAATDAANGVNNPHYDYKHGPSTTLAQQYDRAMNGTNPQTGGAGRPADASKFFNATDMETAITRAEANYAANPGNYPNGNVTVNFNRPIGEGFVGNTPPNQRSGAPIGEYRWSNTATVGIDAQTGKAYTAYPDINKGIAQPNPLTNGVKR